MSNKEGANNLLVIGNGLDLHFGLHTHVNDFRKFLKQQAIFNEFDDALDIFESYGVTWGEYEQSLANLDLELIEKSNIHFPNYLAEHEYERDDTILNMNMYLDSLKKAIKNSLMEMVEQANVDASKIILKDKDREIFNKAKCIINFNYTSTIEYMDITSKPILHIHGCYLNDDELIFGYDKANDNYKNKINIEEDYYIEQQRQSIENFYNGWRKELKIKTLKSFLNKNVCNIETVVVLGHSLSCVDLPYFELIESFVKPNYWNVYYHGENDPILRNIQNYSFSNRKELTNW